MHKEIADYLTRNNAPYTYSLCSVKKEFLVGMSANEFGQAVKAVDKIGADIVAVVVAVKVFFTVYRVGLICG